MCPVSWVHIKVTLFFIAVSDIRSEISEIVGLRV